MFRVWHYKEGRGELRHVIVTSPLISQRRHVLSNQTQFNHATTPLLDKSNHFATFFSLIGDFYRQRSYFPTFETQKNMTYRRLKNCNPGLVVRYTNGQQQFYPLYAFGYRFREIMKFNQSRNAKYVTVMGVLRRPTYLNDASKKP